MRLTEISYDGSRPVDGYGPGFFRVGGAVLEGPVLLLPAGPQLWAGLEDAAPILAAADTLDVLLLGMGAEIAQPPDAFVEALEAAEIGVEIMSSPSAARSYNILLAEGRRIGAALLTVD